MLVRSNLDVIATFRLFKAVDLNVCFLAPTETAMAKSIMDATEENGIEADGFSGVRNFLVTHGIHNFDAQEQGPESRVLVNTKLLANGKVIDTQTSLYRPNTKDGDPRIWIYGLGQHADPYDLLAITKGNDGGLAAINCSKSDLGDVLNPRNALFRELLSGAVQGISRDAEELLEKMRDVAARGFIDTLRPGASGIGYTLETLLGIAANSSRLPDYKGIEIKTGRRKSKRSGRTTIFSKTPDWDLSRLKGSKELLYERGKFNEEKNRVQLFHELSATKTNSYGMRLDVEHSRGFLHQVFVDNERTQNDVTWNILVLQRRLIEKHRETFWITAETSGRRGYADEKFRYSSVEHTGAVDPSVFPFLIEAGVITLDYTITEVRQGVAKDQGYLFKIKTPDLGLLFSSVREHSLLDGPH